MSHALDEIDAGKRFRFGENWAKFLTLLNEERIDDAVQSLQQMLGIENLHGKSFLDIGSGSGLFSLAARRLGARVHSIDFDPQSVACAEALKERFFAHDGEWTIAQGSALDEEYIQSLGKFDVVYSWGVLHHTGEMWKGLGLASNLVKPGGKLFIAIYNDQGWISRYWLWVKRLYNRSLFYKWAMIVIHIPHLLARVVVRAMSGRLRVERGMDMWRDMLDWLGGLPFEVASPSALEAFYRERGYILTRSTLCGNRHGCNELVFERESGTVKP